MFVLEAKYKKLERENENLARQLDFYKKQRKHDLKKSWEDIAEKNDHIKMLKDELDSLEKSRNKANSLLKEGNQDRKDLKEQLKDLEKHLFDVCTDLVNGIRGRIFFSEDSIRSITLDPREECLEIVFGGFNSEHYTLNFKESPWETTLKLVQVLCDICKNTAKDRQTLYEKVESLTKERDQQFDQLSEDYVELVRERDQLSYDNNQLNSYIANDNHYRQLTTQIQDLKTANGRHKKKTQNQRKAINDYISKVEKLENEVSTHEFVKEKLHQEILSLRDKLEKTELHKHDRDREHKPFIKFDLGREEINYHIGSEDKFPDRHSKEYRERMDRLTASSED